MAWLHAWLHSLGRSGSEPSDQRDGVVGNNGDGAAPPDPSLSVRLPDKPNAHFRPIPIEIIHHDGDVEVATAFWNKQIRIRNKILESERAATAARPQVAIPPVRDWFAAAEERARKAETERLERERKASDAERARRQQLAQLAQDRQREWGMVRGQLRDRVAECRNAVNAAENKANSSDDAEAGQGILELAVAERRLAAAERDYAMHAQRSPM